MTHLMVLTLDVAPSDEMFSFLNLRAPLAVWVTRMSWPVYSEWPELRDMKNRTASRQPSAVSVTFSPCVWPLRGAFSTDGRGPGLTFSVRCRYHFNAMGCVYAQGLLVG